MKPPVEQGDYSEALLDVQHADVVEVSLTKDKPPCFTAPGSESAVSNVFVLSKTSWTHHFRVRMQQTLHEHNEHNVQ